MHYIFIFLAVCGIVSCKKKQTEEPPDLGYAYAPENIGKYVVYDVDSTFYDDFTGDTLYFKYRIKEKLAESFTDNEGRPAIKMIRYIKKYDPLKSYDDMVWNIKDVWNYTKTATTLEVTEENVKFTKLVFPVKEETSWNGNAANTLGEWIYTFNYTDHPETINGTAFQNVAFIEQRDDKNKNVIHRQYYIEKYAREVGLVYKEIKDLYSNTVKLLPNGSIMPVEQRIEKGIIYKLTYVTHGVE